MATNDILTPRMMLPVVQGIPIPQNYMAVEYFPEVEVTDEELTWDVLREENALAGLYSIDGKIQPGNDRIFGQMFSDICRIAASRNVKESEWRKLRDPGMVGIRTGVVADIRREVERKVLDKLADCRREVAATREYLCMGALMGHIHWPPPEFPKVGTIPGNAVISVDYNFPSDHKVRADNTAVFGTGAAMWDDADNCDVANTLQIIAEKMENDAGIPADNIDIVLVRKQLRNMAKSTKLLNRMQYTNVEATFSVSQRAIAQYMQGQYGVNIRIYSAMYTYRTEGTEAGKPTTNRVRFLPSNYILAIPRGIPLGDFATSPAAANNWQPGLFTWTKQEENPWRTEVGVGINGFPRVTNTNAVFVVQVEEDPEGLKVIS